MFLLDIYLVHINQQKYPINRNYKLSAYIYDWIYNYSMKFIDRIELILYDRIIYTPKHMRRNVIYLYHFYPE